VSGAAPTRLAVVGVGHLGRHHARLASTLPETTFVAAVDIQLSRAEEATRETDAAALDDYRELVGRADAAVVAVPTVAHLDVAVWLLEHGIDVLVEKPMAVSVAEADRMIAAASASGVILAVGHTERFNPAIEAALAIIEQPRFIEIDRLSGFPERSLDIDVIFDVMIHDLDLLLAIDSSGVAAVEAVGVPVLTPKVDIANARIRFVSGCIANVTASRISRDQVRKVRCFQRDMYVSVDAGARELDVWRLQRTEGERPAIAGGRVPVARDEPLRRELEDFVHAVRHRQAPRVSGVAGRAALDLATQVAAAIARTADHSGPPS
jgi:predicted dehydrogenase